MAENARPATPTEIRDMEQAQRLFMFKVLEERRRQDEKWGKNFVAVDRMLVILGEEIGEVCKARLDSSGNSTPNKATVNDLLDEIVQSAAVLSKLYELVQAGAR